MALKPRKRERSGLARGKAADIRRDFHLYANTGKIEGPELSILSIILIIYGFRAWRPINLPLGIIKVGGMSRRSFETVFHRMLDDDRSFSYVHIRRCCLLIVAYMRGVLGKQMIFHQKSEWFRMIMNLRDSWRQSKCPNINFIVISI